MTQNIKNYNSMSMSDIILMTTAAVLLLSKQESQIYLC